MSATTLSATTPCCLDEKFLEEYPLFPLLLSEGCKSAAKAVAVGKASGWHYIWIIPANLVTSLLGIALSSLAGIVDLLCAAFFACLSCSPENSARQKIFGIIAAVHLVDIPLSLFLSIFKPDVESISPFLNCITSATES